jgi:hypothetical protein
MCPSASKSRQANGLAQGVRCQPVAAVPHSSARCVLGCPYPPSRLVSLVLVTVRVAAFDVAWQGYGSAQPTVVLSGHISTPEDGPVASRTGQIQCPPGGWCSAGIAIACDVGFYTDPQIAPTQRTSPAACIACPRHSTSSSGSTSIDDCGCVEGRVQVPGGSKSSCGCPFGLHESESGMCDVCPRFTSSSAGAVTCDICAEGRFRLDARTSVSTENCNQCPTGAICSFNTTVATMELLEGFWRISMEKCPPANGKTITHRAEGVSTPVTMVLVTARPDTEARGASCAMPPLFRSFCKSRVITTSLQRTHGAIIARPLSSELTLFSLLCCCSCSE